MVNIGTFIFLTIVLCELLMEKSIRKLIRVFLIITAIMELIIERGYFIQFGKQQIAYRTISEAILFLLCIFWIICSHKDINQKLLNAFFLCIFSLIIGWILLIMFPSNAKGATFEISWDQILINRIGLQPIRFNSSMIIEIIQIIMFLVILLTVYSKFTFDDYIKTFFGFLKAGKYFVYLNIIEIITKCIFRSNIFVEIVDSILGTATVSMTSLISRGSGYALVGLTKESSHYVFSIAILLIMYFAGKRYCQVNSEYGKK